MFNRMCSFGFCLNLVVFNFITGCINSAIHCTFQSNGFVKYSETSPLSKDTKRHEFMCIMKYKYVSGSEINIQDADQSVC